MGRFERGRQEGRGKEGRMGGHILTEGRVMRKSDWLVIEGEGETEE